MDDDDNDVYDDEDCDNFDHNYDGANYSLYPCLSSFFDMMLLITIMMN